MIGKMVITYEQIQLCTPNKYHIVSYGKINHFIPILSGLNNAKMK